MANIIRILVAAALISAIAAPVMAEPTQLQSNTQKKLETVRKAIASNFAG